MCDLFTRLRMKQDERGNFEGYLTSLESIRPNLQKLMLKWFVRRI